MNDEYFMLHDYSVQLYNFYARRKISEALVVDRTLEDMLYL